MFGESRFVIFPTPNPNRGGHTQMGISVKDVGAAVRELKGRGVTFEEYDTPASRSTAFSELNGGYDRQRQCEDAPSTGAGFQPQPSAVLLGEPLTDVQA